MADVIDDEELIATRRLNGVDDKLYQEEKEAILKRKAKELDDLDSFADSLRPEQRYYTNLIKKLVENTRKRGSDGR
jgi:hypothetical protein